MIKAFNNKGSSFFLLKNDELSCLLQVKNGKLLMLHLGRPISEEDAPALCPETGSGWGCSVMNGELCLDSLPLAFSSGGSGDFRELPLELFLKGKILHPDFSFVKAETGVSFRGRLPGARGERESLEITLDSQYASVRIIFSLFETALTEKWLVEAKTEGLAIGKCMSLMADLQGDFIFSSFDGGWISEACRHDAPVSFSKLVNESLSGFSSNRHNPGFLLSRRGSGTDLGEVYGFNLIYSGNHYSSVQKSLQNLTRVMQGINPSGFLLELENGGIFEAPEAVVAFSSKGENGLRRCMHSFVNAHIIPQHFQGRERPVLYNSWEGCMFSFSERRLLTLAKKAKALGCELFVLDDGWFGQRNSDEAGLGDYNVNLKKLPGGLEGLSEKLGKLGLDFGLWFEPEAVNPDSELFRAHPDWAIKTDGPSLLGRNELLLDLRKAEVRDYIVENVSSAIDRAGIKYVKWDMNRHSPLLGAEAHEYILGLYEVLERIFSPRPQVLLESCASGGNRFDLGMLSFGPQAWASDNTDPIERLEIQQGLSCLYPQSAMGAHVSASPHLQSLRSTPLSTRANVSFFGIFGLELDLNHLSRAEFSELKAAVSFYKEHRKAFQFGSLSLTEAEEGAYCWQLSSEEETIVGLFHTLVHSAPGYELLRVTGLEPGRLYSVEARQQSLRIGQFSGMIKYIAPIDPGPDSLLVREADRLASLPDGGFSALCSGSALSSGIPLNLKFPGTGYNPGFRNQGDFSSNIYIIKAGP